MIGGKSAEKLVLTKEIINDLPQSRLKSVTISWKALDSEEAGTCMWCPCLHVEFFEGDRPDDVDVILTEDKPYEKQGVDGKQWND